MRHGTRFLLISCFAPGEPQFRAIAEILGRLARVDGFAHLDWAPSPGLPALDLGRRRVLRWVLVCGHGAERQPRIGGGQGRSLTASDLRLPADSILYIASCYQGQDDLRAAWARGCGLPAERVLGCPSETDSFLSTCLLLHVLEQGPAALPRRFVEWCAANRRFQPRFGRLREAYRGCGGQAQPFLEAARELADLGPAEDFLAVVRRHPSLFTGLAPV